MPCLSVPKINLISQGTVLRAWCWLALWLFNRAKGGEDHENADKIAVLVIMFVLFIDGCLGTVSARLVPMATDA